MKGLPFSLRKSLRRNTVFSPAPISSIWATAPLAGSMVASRRRTSAAASCHRSAMCCSEGGLVEIQRTHKSAPALNRGHQSPVNEHVDGASESHWADVELGAELGLRRKLVSLPVVTVGNATAHRTDDAHVGGFVRIGRRRS